MKLKLTVREYAYFLDHIGKNIGYFSIAGNNKGVVIEGDIKKLMVKK